MRHLWILVLATVAGHPVAAQNLSVEAGRWLQEGGSDWSTYRVGFGRPLAGGIGYSLNGTMIARRGAVEQRLWGLGADLTLFRGGSPGPYGVVGVAGGVGTGESDLVWGSWAAGLGYEIVPVPFLALALEGRWREISSGRHGGLELGLRLGLNWGGGGGGGGGGAVSGGRLEPSALGEWDLPASEPWAADPRRLERTSVAVVDRVLLAATDAMGTPYKWGGNGEGGFDCSGLIQYAYGTEGIALPRRSADQARAGRAVSPNQELLSPGDILTFSERGGSVSHVGLYLGAGEFIHSASTGVRISRLHEDDPDGRWWLARWVGARRLLE